MKKLYSPELREDEFLRVRNVGGAIEFSLVRSRAKVITSNSAYWIWRYHLPIMEIVNRHTKKSKAERINNLMWAMDVFIRELRSL